MAIDTSTEQAGVALTDGARMFEAAWSAGREQTVSVLAEIDHQLRRAGVGARDVRAVAVAIGPGTFNGLRVGLSIAKGFALGTDVALVGVSTLTVAARPFLDAVGVIPVVAAGRGRLVWSADASGTSPVNGTIGDLATYLGTVPGPVIVAGEMSEEQARTLEGIPGVTIPTAAGRRRRPGALAEIGWARYLAGDVDDAVYLSPVYVHAGGAGSE